LVAGPGKDIVQQSLPLGHESVKFIDQDHPYLISFLQQLLRSF